MQAFLSFVPDVATLQRGFAAFVVLLDNGLPSTPSRIRLRRSGHQMLHKKVRMEKSLHFNVEQFLRRKNCRKKTRDFLLNNIDIRYMF